MSFSLVVRDLGKPVDSEFTFGLHIDQVRCCWYYQLRQLRVIPCSLTSNAAVSLVHALFCVQPPWLLRFHLLWSPGASDGKAEAGRPGYGATHWWCSFPVSLGQSAFEEGSWRGAIYTFLFIDWLIPYLRPWCLALVLPHLYFSHYTSNISLYARSARLSYCPSIFRTRLLLKSSCPTEPWKSMHHVVNNLISALSYFRPPSLPIAHHHLSYSPLSNTPLISPLKVSLSPSRTDSPASNSRQKIHPSCELSCHLWPSG